MLKHHFDTLSDILGMDDYCNKDDRNPIAATLNSILDQITDDDKQPDYDHVPTREPNLFHILKSAIKSADASVALLVEEERSKSASLHNELKETRSKMVLVLQKNECLKTENRRLASRVALDKLIKNRYSGVQRENAQLKGKVCALESLNAILQANVERIRTELNQAVSQKVQSEIECSELRRENHSLRNESRDADVQITPHRNEVMKSDLIRALNDALTTKQFVDSETSILKDDLNTCQATLQKVRLENCDFQNQIDDYITDISTLREHVDRSNDEIVRLESALESMEEQYSDSINYSQMSHGVTEVQSNNRIKDLQAQLSNLQSQVQDFTTVCVNKSKECSIFVDDLDFSSQSLVFDSLQCLFDRNLTIVVTLESTVARYNWLKQALNDQFGQAECLPPVLTAVINVESKDLISLMDDSSDTVTDLVHPASDSVVLPATLVNDDDLVRRVQDVINRLRKAELSLVAEQEHHAFLDIKYNKVKKDANECERRMVEYREQLLRDSSLFQQQVCSLELQLEGVEETKLSLITMTSRAERAEIASIEAHNKLVQLENCHSEFIGLKIKYEKLDQERKAATDAIFELENRIVSFENENAVLKSTISERNEQEQCQIRIDAQIKQQYSDMVLELNDLRQYRSNRNEQLLCVQDFTCQAALEDDHREVVEEANIELQRLLDVETAKYGQLEELLGVKCSIIEQLENKLQIQFHELEMANATHVTELQMQLEVAQNSYHVLKNDLDVLADERTTLKSQLDATEEKLVILENVAKVADENRMSTLEQMEQVHERSRSEWRTSEDNLTAVLSEYKCQLAELTGQNNDLVEKLENLQNCGPTENEVDLRLAFEGQLAALLVEKQNLVVEIDEMDRKYNECNGNLIDVMSQLDVVQKECDQQDQQKRDLQSQLESVLYEKSSTETEMKRQQHSLSNDIERLCSTADQLRNENDLLQTQLSANETLQSEHDRLRVLEVEGLTTTVSNLEEHNRILVNEKGEIRTVLRGAIDMLQSVRSQTEQLSDTFHRDRLETFDDIGDLTDSIGDLAQRVTVLDTQAQKLYEENCRLVSLDTDLQHQLSVVEQRNQTLSTVISEKDIALNVECEKSTRLTNEVVEWQESCETAELELERLNMQIKDSDQSVIINGQRLLELEQLLQLKYDEVSRLESANDELTSRVELMTSELSIGVDQNMSTQEPSQVNNGLSESQLMSVAQRCSEIESGLIVANSGLCQFVTELSDQQREEDVIHNYANDSKKRSADLCVKLYEELAALVLSTKLLQRQLFASNQRFHDAQSEQERLICAIQADHNEQIENLQTRVKDYDDLVKQQTDQKEELDVLKLHSQMQLAALSDDQQAQLEASQQNVQKMEIEIDRLKADIKIRAEHADDQKIAIERLNQQVQLSHASNAELETNIEQLQHLLQDSTDKLEQVRQEYQSLVNQYEKVIVDKDIASKSLEDLRMQENQLQLRLREVEIEKEVLLADSDENCASLEKAESALQDVRSTFESANQTIVSLETELIAEQCNSAQLLNEIRESNDKLVATESEYRLMASKLQDLQQTNLDAERQPVEMLNDALSSARNEIQLRDNELSALKNQLATTLFDVEHLHNDVTRYRDLLSSKNEDLTDLENQLKSVASDGVDLQSQLAEKSIKLTEALARAEENDERLEAVEKWSKQVSNELAEKKGRMIELEKDLIDAKSEAAAKNAKNEDLLKETINIQECLAAVRSEQTLSLVQIVDLQNEITSHRISAQESSARLADALDKITLHGDELVSLKSQLTVSLAEVENVRSDASLKDDKLIEMNTKLESIVSERSELKCQVEQEQEKLNQALLDIASKTENLMSVEKTLEQKTGDMVQKNDRIKALETELVELKKCLELKLEKKQTELELVENNCSILKTEVESLHKTVEDAGKLYEVSEGALCEVRLKLESANQTVLSLELVVIAEQKKSAQLLNQVSDTNDKLVAAESKYRLMELKLEDLQQINLEAERQRVEIANGALNDAQSEIQLRDDELSALKNQLATSLLDVEHLHNDVTRYRDLLSSKNEDLADLDNQLKSVASDGVGLQSQLEEKTSKLMEAHASVEESNERLEAVEKWSKQVSNELAEQNGRMIELKQDLIQAKSEVAAENAKNEDLLKEIVNIQESLTTVQSEKTLVLAQLVDLQNEITSQRTSAQESSARLADALNEITLNRDELVSLKSQLTVSLSEVENVRSDASLKDDKLIEVNTKLESIVSERSELKCQVEKEREKLSHALLDVASKTESLMSTEKTLEQKTGEMGRKISRIKALETELAESKKCMTLKLEKKQTELELLESNCSILKAEVEALNKTVADSGKLHAAAQKTSSDKVVALNSEIVALEASMKSQTELVDGQLKEKTDALDTMKHHFGQLMQVYDELQADDVVIKKELENAKNALSTLEQTVVEKDCKIEQCENSIINLKSNIDTVEKRNKDIEASVDKLNTRLVDSQQETMITQSRLKDAEAQVIKLEEATELTLTKKKCWLKNKEILEEQHAKLEHTLRSELKKAHNENKQLTNSNSRFNNEIKQLTNNIVSIEEESEKSVLEIEKLKKELNDAVEEQKQLIDKRREIAKDFDNMRKAKESYQSKCEILNAKLAKSLKTIEKQESNSKASIEKVSTRKSTFSSTSSSEMSSGSMTKKSNYLNPFKRYGQESGSVNAKKTRKSTLVDKVPCKNQENPDVLVSAYGSRGIIRTRSMSRQLEPKVATSSSDEAEGSKLSSPAMSNSMFRLVDTTNSPRKQRNESNSIPCKNQENPDVLVSAYGSRGIIRTRSMSRQLEPKVATSSSDEAEGSKLSSPAMSNSMFRLVDTTNSPRKQRNESNSSNSFLGFKSPATSRLINFSNTNSSIRKTLEMTSSKAKSKLTVGTDDDEDVPPDCKAQ